MIKPAFPTVVYWMPICCRVEATNSAMPQRIPPAQSVFGCVPFSDEASGGRVRFLREEKKTISGRSVSPPSRFRGVEEVKEL